MYKYLLLLMLTFSHNSWAFSIHDGHIHYFADAHPYLSPQQALAVLDESGIDCVVVSSRPSAATEKLYSLAPDRIVPSLMPYRTLRDKFTWHTDPAIIDYINKELARGIYKGFGEFHISGDEAKSRVFEQIIDIAYKNKLMLSAHTDIEATRVILSLKPDMEFIWAHCGLNESLDDVHKMLVEHPKLHCDLSMRHDVADEDGNINPVWKQFFEKYPDRFILGNDTYVIWRWEKLADLVEDNRVWLRQLSEKTRNKIAKENFTRLYGCQ